MAAKSPSLYSLLECPICLNDCEDPRVLTCLHSLCRKCLDQHISTSAERNHFLCPSCRHKCEVPAGGATAIPKNFLLNSLKEIIEQQASGESDHVSASASQQSDFVKPQFKECANSTIVKGEHTEVTVYCAECAKALCSNCESNHQAFADLSSHRLLPITSVNPGNIQADVARQTALKCDQHPSLPTDMYCDTCRVPVCWKCCLLKHKQHEYREIQEAAKESKTVLSKLTKTAEKITTNLQKNMQELKVSETNINTECNDACRKVQENAEEIRKLVTQREKQVVQEIRQAQNTAVTQLSAACKEAEINIAAVESLLSYIQVLLASDNATNQVVHAPGLQEQLRQHEVAPLQSVTLDVNLERTVQSLSALNSMLGSVSASQATATQGSPGGAVAEQSKASLGSHLLEVRPKKAKDIRAASGLVMMGDYVYITGYDEPYLWIYNLKTNKENQNEIPGLEAAGLALLGGDALVITDYEDKLHRIKTDQDMEIIEHTVKKMPFSPSAVSYHSASNKLIIANMSDCQIVVCDVEGTIQNRIDVKTDTRDMRSALSSAHGYIVLDWYGQLSWVSRNGATEHTYSDEVSTGSHIVQDSQGRVIIADAVNDRVHLVGVNKQLSHYLLTVDDGIWFPRCLYLDEANSRLLVGCSDIKDHFIIRMYKWPFTLEPTGGDYTSQTQHKLLVKLVSYQ